MIKSWNIKHSLIAGAGLILISNAVALSGVYYNRSGEPDSTVMLTERELGAPLAWRINKENNGLSLRLIWNVAKRYDGKVYAYQKNFPDWLDAKKMAELGFDIDSEKLKRQTRLFYRRSLPRESFLVIEFDGDAYRSDVKRAQNRVRNKKILVNKNPGLVGFTRELKNSTRALKQLIESASRLYVIDASLDQETLRRKYSDRSKYIIAKGQVRLWLSYDEKNNDTDVSGYIAGLSINRINISKKHRPSLDVLLDQGENRYDIDGPPRYAVKVSWGRRLEPWVHEVIVLKQSE